MDLDDFRSIMDNAGVDVWTFIDSAILVASLDYGHELKRRRDNIVERLFATSVADKCRNCDFGGVGGSVPEAVDANGRVHEEEEEEDEVREKPVNVDDEEDGGDDDDDDDVDPFAGLFDDEQKSILDIKEKLEEPDLTEEALVELLQNLEDMEITFQALQETDIGRHVNRVLRKHPSNEVRRLAKQLVKKWKETVDEWVKFNQSSDLQPPSLIADEDSPQQRSIHNSNRQQVPDFGYSPAPQNGYSSSSSKHSNVTEPERRPARPVAPPPPARRESPSPAKPSRPSPSQQQPIQREKEHKEIDFDSARKRLKQNYKQAENAKKQRTIQVMDIHEIPKPKKGGFFPRKGGSSQGGSRHW